MPSTSSSRSGLEVLGVDQLDLDLDAVVDAAVLERLDHRLVGVVELHVLADQGDPHLALGGVGASHHRLPLGQVRRRAPRSRSGRGRGRRRPRRGRRAAPCRCCRRRGRRSPRRREGWRRERSCSRISRSRRPSERQTSACGWIPIRRSSLTECWVGFVFSSPGVADVGHQGQVDEHAALRPEVRVELADRLEEGQRLDVADRAADLGDHEVDRLRLGDDQDFVLDLVGDVRDHLHGGAEVVAAALALDHRVVDARRR